MIKEKIKNKLFKSTIKIVGNKGLGKNPLGNTIKKYLIKNSKTNEIIVNGCKMYLDKNDVMQMSLFDYEPIETDIIKSNVKENDIVVDVGANIGYFTLLMAKNNSRVFSYEPAPDNFKILQKNVHQNNFSQNVTLHNTAVSNFIGTSKLYLQEKHTGGHQLGFDRFQTNNSIEVPVTKLDLDRIDFAKIDVEGSELNVLKGMKVLPKKLLIEFSPQKLQNNGTKLEDFFKFIKKFSVKEVSKNGLIEADFDKLRKINFDANLFLY
jgi:FkbM family methyltransferase